MSLWAQKKALWAHLSDNNRRSTRPHHLIKWAYRLTTLTPVLDIVRPNGVVPQVRAQVPLGGNGHMRRPAPIVRPAPVNQFNAFNRPPSSPKFPQKPTPTLQAPVTTPPKINIPNQVLEKFINFKNFQPKFSISSICNHFITLHSGPSDHKYPTSARAA